jgi:hypothetical protein
LLEVTLSRRFWRDLDDRHGQVSKNLSIVTKPKKTSAYVTCPTGHRKKLTVIQKTKKKSRKNGVPTMGVLPTAPNTFDQNSIPAIS